MYLTPEWMVTLSDQRRDGGAGIPVALENQLRDFATDWAKRKPEEVSVTDKPELPHSPTDDPRDYVSIATYWWPNPDTPDGLPYIRKDGELSPDVALYDRSRWELAAQRIAMCGRAAALLDERYFAAITASQVDAWFTNPEYGMHPHLRHAQFIPGKNTGRCFGIIDFGLYMPTVLDAISLVIRYYPDYIDQEQQAALTHWCSRFYDWLQTDPLALEEQTRTNNHGTCYDRMMLHLALFLGDADGARRYIADAVDRVDHHIEPDGRQPRELARTLSHSYSLMNLSAFVDIAVMARNHVGERIWNRRLQAAADFLRAHATVKTPWPYEQIKPIDYRTLDRVLRRIAAHTDRDHVVTYPHRLPADHDPVAFEVLSPLHPFGNARGPQANAQG